MNRDRPFDAILLIAFGGPEGPDQIRPFLENVVRGKPVPPNRIEEVVKHYQMFGGVSPLPEITRQQATMLGDRLRDDGIDLPVYVGMRFWHPFIADTIRSMAEAGVRRAIALIAAPHHSHASCTYYKDSVREARAGLHNLGLCDVEITYVDSWYDHPDFVRANAGNIREAIGRLGPQLRDRARIIFTAHSIPVAMADACRYREQLTASITQVMKHVGPYDSTLVYQSRSGRPQDPWLEPDVCDYLKAEFQNGLEAVVLAPIGFVIDHIEVLYDLDVRAGEMCRQLNLPMTRAYTLNDNPLFIDMMADLVKRTWDRAHSAIPLPIVAARHG
jgi:ferrochelatase